MIQDQYEVEDLLAKTIVNNEPYYKVKWKGFEITASTWENKNNLGGLKTHDQRYTFNKNPLNDLYKNQKFDTLEELYEYEKKINDNNMLIVDNQDSLNDDVEYNNEDQKDENFKVNLPQKRQSKKKIRKFQPRSKSQTRKIKKHQIFLKVPNTDEFEKIAIAPKPVNTEKLQVSTTSQMKKRSEDIEQNKLTEIQVKQKDDIQTSCSTDSIIQIVKICQTYNPSSKLQKVAYVRKYKSVDKEIVDSVIPIEELFQTKELMKLTLTYFVHEMEHQKPILSDFIDKFNKK